MTTATVAVATMKVAQISNPVSGQLTCAFIKSDFQLWVNAKE